MSAGGARRPAPLFAGVEVVGAGPPLLDVVSPDGVASVVDGGGESPAAHSHSAGQPAFEAAPPTRPAVCAWARGRQGSSPHAAKVFAVTTHSV